MRILLIFLILFFFHNCSFDNKSGIWKSESNVVNKKDDEFYQFEDLITTKSSFSREINIKDDFSFKLPDLIESKEWTDIFYNRYNNSGNFKYTALYNKYFRSNKITKYKVDNYILYENDNIISSDQNGNINIYSLNNEKKISSFNFYKKKFKKNIKKLNLIVENRIIYVSDNLGYLYSFDYTNNKILWAKNFKIPFRSNLKIFKNKLILSNQNNDLYYINKNNGNILKLIPTEETIIKNKFINNISLDKNNTFYLNTFGSLYSIDNKKMRINWFINLNETANDDPSNLFFGNKLINSKEKIIVTTNYFTYVINSSTGTILYKKNFSSFVKPIIINNYLFLISKNDLLICLNLNNGEIIYSYDINEKISNFLNTKKKKVNLKKIMMINNQIFIFLKNSYLLVFNIEGNLEKIVKLPFKLNTQPILIEEKMIYFDFKNKISIIN